MKTYSITITTTNTSNTIELTTVKIVTQKIFLLYDMTVKNAKVSP